MEVCSAVKEKISYLKSLKREQLERWQDAEIEEIEVAGKKGILTIFKDKISEQKDLLVVQAFYPTWKFPNYFSIGRIGRVFAEGFFIELSGNVTEVEDADLWPYR